MSSSDRGLARPAGFLDDWLKLSKRNSKGLPGRYKIVLQTAFFLIGVFSPAGMLGTREGGTAWLLPLVAAQGEDTSWFAAAVLIVGASELITNTACAALGLIYLRPDRLLRGHAALQHAANQPTPTPLPSPDEARPGADQPDHR